MIDEYSILKKKHKKNNGFATTALLVSLGIIILLVAIFVFLLGKVDKKNDGNISSQNSNTQETCTENSCTTSCGTKEHIFNENLKTIKDAAVSYFTLERMPAKVGEKKTITLAEMQKEKMVLSIIDSKNNSCDGEKSYVEVTKDSTEYVMKIFLSCSDMEDYIIIHIGCYDYCKGTVCERQDEQGKTEFEYEYRKTTSCTMSEWSSWGEWKTTRESTSNLKKEDIKTETVTKTIVDTIDLIKGSTKISCTKYGSDYILSSDKKYCIKYGSKLDVIEGTPSGYKPVCEDKTYFYNSNSGLCEKSVSESVILEKTATKNPDTYNCLDHPGTDYNEKTGKCEGTITKEDKKPINVIEGTEYCSSEGFDIVNGKCIKTTIKKEPAITDSSKSCTEYGSEYSLSGNDCIASIKIPVSVEKVPVYETKTVKEEYSCWKLEGTTKTVFDCSTGSCKMVPQTSYETVQYTCTKDVEKTVQTGTKCPDGSTPSGNSCVKYVDGVDKKPAKTVYGSPSCAVYGDNAKLSGNECIITTTQEEPVKTTSSTNSCAIYGKEYKINNGDCVANISVPVSYEAKKNATTYNCNSLKNDGYSSVNIYSDKCVKNDTVDRKLTMKPILKITGFTCKNGYNQNGHMCEKTITIEVDRKPADKIVIGDKCPDGYKQDGAKCTKNITKEEKVTYYRYATRTCNGGYTDIKWSYYDDRALIDKGYTLTGNKREIKDVFTK